MTVSDVDGARLLGKRTHALEPLFVFSLPRSGSTLLQRLLASHPDITGSTETWILLPPLYALRETGAYSEFAHHTMAGTVTDFSNDLPGGVDDYYAAIRSFAMGLYERAAGPDARYYLDKSPPYSLVADEIVKVFPHTKSIFLWRNPLAVVASLVETYGHGAWNVHHYAAQLFQGVERLVDTSRRLGHDACNVTYDDLVHDPQPTLHRVCEYLEIAYTDDLITGFTNVLPRRGDLPGMRRYGTLSDESLDKWKATFANPIRKRWARRYLRWLGHNRLASMGYRLEDLEQQLREIPSRPDRLASDAAHVAYGVGMTKITSSLLGSSYFAWPPKPGRPGRLLR